MIFQLKQPLFSFAILSLMACSGGGGGSVSSRSSSPQGPSVVGQIEQADVHTDGTFANAAINGIPMISSSGRYVVFASGATNLVDNDTNGVTDVFIRDLQQKTTRRISVSAAGVEGNAASLGPAISENERYVVFESAATNLVAGDANSRTDVFRYDLQNNTVELVSISATSAQGNNNSTFGSVSADGNLIVFQSLSTNFSAISDTNSAADSFLKNMTSGALTILTERRDGAGARTGVTATFTTGRPIISGDGAVVYFHHNGANVVTGDTNGVRDLFRYTVNNDQLDLVTRNLSAVQTNADAWSPLTNSSGRYAVFHSTSTNLTADAADDPGSKIFRYDAQTGAMEIMTRASSNNAVLGGCSEAAMTASGDRVIFSCINTTSTMVDNDTNNRTDIFIRKVTAGTTERISLGPDDEELNGDSTFGRLSGAGRRALFLSTATNIPSSSTDGLNHAFVKYLEDEP